ncbi:uncharacterized protein P884DRAFT_45709 [Thermothelomyces heterothallicus CBS 202.75]|uniref:uncharacterized protein n=1 Tax=Thermothelomyces heterothallicus CBS 202.75 TaxID=1149848 RepID=UPI00374254AC
MSKRTVFTTVTPLPAGISRQIVLDFLHDHQEMIDLNPLVKERHPIPPPSHASADEYRCQWYSLTDKISYFPGVAGDVTYTCAFNDLPTGLETHCYAPAGLTIREKWTVRGSLPGEPPQPVEPGLQVPQTGLYLREDVDMRCNVVMTGFVKKTLKKSHAALAERLKIKAEIASTASSNTRSWTGSDSGSATTPEPSSSATMESSGLSSSSSQRYYNNNNPAAVELASRPPSAASSVSLYSVQSSSFRSEAASSLGISPNSPVSGAPATYGDHYRQQTQPSSQYVAQPKHHHHHHAAQSSALPAPLPEPVSVTYPAPEPPIQAPATPFLRTPEADWPLKHPVPSCQQQQQQQQQQRPRPRPQTHLFIQAYRPPPRADHAERRQNENRDDPAVGPSGGGSKPSSSSCSSSPGGKLSGDALWQALGGGRPGVAVTAAAAAAATRHNRAISDAAFEYNSYSSNNYHGLRAMARTRARASSQGQQEYHRRGREGGEGALRSHDDEHPDYPHLSPYEEEEQGEGQDRRYAASASASASASVAAGSATAGVVGGDSTRWLSMPPPSLRVDPAATGAAADMATVRQSSIAALGR